MTEYEKMLAGEPFSVRDPEVNASKLNAVKGCQKLNSIPVTEEKEKEKVIRELFGSVGKEPQILPTFVCDNGKNIHVGDYFLANYNVTILDGARFTAGDHVWIGPNTLISCFNHPMTPAGRRQHLAIVEPVTLGDDVWIGGNCTIMPGVTIGNNVIVAGGAVVTKDVPDNTLVGGVPAKKIRDLENDL